MTSARLFRYAPFLSGFDYTVKCKIGKENQNVDCLSSAPMHYTKTTTDELIWKEVNQAYAESIFLISSEVITAEDIRTKTANDPELQDIVNRLKSTSLETEYTLNEGIVFRHDRVYIPNRLSARILQELHQTHLRITKMKQLARRVLAKH